MGPHFTVQGTRGSRGSRLLVLANSGSSQHNTNAATASPPDGRCTTSFSVYGVQGALQFRISSVNLKIKSEDKKLVIQFFYKEQNFIVSSSGLIILHSIFELSNNN